MAAGFIGVTTPGANTGDNLQETRGPPPPNHPTLISADLCGNGFYRSNHPDGENTGDNVPETHGLSSRGHYQWQCYGHFMWQVTP